jgi:hypothetical protein
METKLKTLSDVATRTAQIARELIGSECRDAAVVTQELVPKDHGVYLWRDKNSDRVSYIGSAVGRDGLRQRIAKQHLQPGYTKSVFRKAILDRAGGDPKGGSVHFIRETFTISWLACPDDGRSVIHAAEGLLIGEP